MVICKRSVMYALLGSITIVVALWTALLLLTRGEVRSEKFSDYAALERSESWQKGWVPTFVPKEAKDIYEEHNLDTNSVYGQFSSPSFSPELAGLRRLTDAEKVRLIDGMSWGGLKHRIDNLPVFVWCDRTERMMVHLVGSESDRMIYWGRADKSCAGAIGLEKKGSML